MQLLLQLVNDKLLVRSMVSMICKHNVHILMDIQHMEQHMLSMQLERKRLLSRLKPIRLRQLRTRNRNKRTFLMNIFSIFFEIVISLVSNEDPYFHFDLFCFLLFYCWKQTTIVFWLYVAFAIAFIWKSFLMFTMNSIW